MTPNGAGQIRSLARQLVELKADRLRERDRVLGRDQLPSPKVRDLGNTADPRGDERCSGGHRFEQHARHTFGTAGQNKQVGGAIPVGQLLVGAWPAEPNYLAQLELGNLLL